jgi:hypothetical protein
LINKHLENLKLILDIIAKQNASILQKIEARDLWILKALSEVLRVLEGNKEEKP